MMKVNIRNNGYTLHYDDGEQLDSDRSHDYLFAFVTKDLKELNTLMEAYIAKGFDGIANTAQAHDYSQGDLEELDLFLRDLHPYFRGKALGEALVELMTHHVSTLFSERVSDIRVELLNDDDDPLFLNRSDSDREDLLSELKYEANREYIELL